MRLLTAIAAAAALSIALGAVCAAGTVPDPLVMPNKAVGGGPFGQYTPGVYGGTGLQNIGLLIKTWGKVTAPPDTTNKFFYIDDGSGLNDTSGYVGLRVSYANLAPGNTITPPSQNQYVVITGISSTTDLNGRIVPTLRPRRQSDITVLP